MMISLDAFGFSGFPSTASFVLVSVYQLTYSVGIAHAAWQAPRGTYEGLLKLTTGRFSMG